MDVPRLLDKFGFHLGANDDRRLAVDGNPVGIALVADREPGIAGFHCRIQPLQLLVFLILIALVHLDPRSEDDKLRVLNLAIGPGSPLPDIPPPSTGWTSANLLFDCAGKHANLRSLLEILDSHDPVEIEGRLLRDLDKGLGGPLPATLILEEVGKIVERLGAGYVLAELAPAVEIPISLSLIFLSEEVRDASEGEKKGQDKTSGGKAARVLQG